MAMLRPSLFRPQDKSKIKLAISLRRIGPADVPPSAKMAAPVNTAPLVQRKRSATQAGFSQTSQTATQSTSGSSSFPTTQQTQEDEPEEEPRDELYCTFVTSVVGIQYYKGIIYLFYKPD